VHVRMKRQRRGYPANFRSSGRDYYLSRASLRAREKGPRSAASRDRREYSCHFFSFCSICSSAGFHGGVFGSYHVLLSRFLVLVVVVVELILQENPCRWFPGKAATSRSCLYSPSTSQHVRYNAHARSRSAMSALVSELDQLKTCYSSCGSYCIVNHGDINNIVRKGYDYGYVLEHLSLIIHY
jgi:hypothetical protein